MIRYKVKNPNIFGNFLAGQQAQRRNKLADEAIQDRQSNRNWLTKSRGRTEETWGQQDEDRTRNIAREAKQDKRGDTRFEWEQGDRDYQENTLRPQQQKQFSQQNTLTGLNIQNQRNSLNDHKTQQAAQKVMSAIASLPDAKSKQAAINGIQDPLVKRMVQQQVQEEEVNNLNLQSAQMQQQAQAITLHRAKLRDTSALVMSATPETWPQVAQIIEKEFPQAAKTLNLNPQSPQELQQTQQGFLRLAGEDAVKVEAALRVLQNRGQGQQQLSPKDRATIEEKWLKEYQALNSNPVTGQPNEGAESWEAFKQRKVQEYNQGGQQQSGGDQGQGQPHDVTAILKDITPEQQQQAAYYIKAIDQVNTPDEKKRMLSQIQDEKVRVAVGVELDRQADSVIQPGNKKLQLSDDTRLEAQRQKQRERDDQFINAFSPVY